MWQVAHAVTVSEDHSIARDDEIRPAGAVVLADNEDLTVEALVGVHPQGDQDLGERTSNDSTSWSLDLVGYGATFLLGIYGGFFSGGYVTMLTAAWVALFGMTFLQAVATTKVINVFSSGIAAAIFIGRGLVDLRLGMILGVAMFAGALLGGRLALFLKTIWPA